MTDPDQSPMWGYWKDKHGIAGALKYQYPELVKDDFLLTAAMVQIELAEMAIDRRMEELNV